MKIKELKYAPFSFQLKTHFTTGKHTLTHRKGIILRLESENGNYSFGEVSPLPGFSSESLDEVINTISRLKILLEDFETSRANEFYDKLSFEFPFAPSLIFGVEQAIHSLLFQASGQIPIKSIINVSALVGILPADKAILEVRDKISKGFKTIKLKSSSHDSERLWSILKSLIDESVNEVNFRIDANGKWTLPEACETIEKLSQFNIEFIEQPVERIDELLKLCDLSPIPIAPDESANNFENCRQLILNPKVNFIVLKPMLIGFNRSIELVDLAQSENKSVIVSSLFEGVVGMHGLIFLASKINSDFAHGLGTIEYFENNSAHENFSIESGSINFTSDLYPPKFNFSKLVFK